MTFSRFAKIGAGLAATALALAACGAAEEEDSSTGSGTRTVQEIKDSGKIRLGVFSDKAPFGSVDSNGDYV